MGTATRMDATRAINGLADGSFTALFDAAHAALLSEAAAIAAEWESLGRFGGQRADHAAILLQRLSGPLADLRDLGATCAEQLDAIQADPFGDRPDAGRIRKRL